MKVRTRIAPSPTGDPHLGTAYIALFNWVFARQHGGEFIVRIEDTDQARSTSASENTIIEALRWLGLDWDAGPDIGGEHGPYRQSDRLSIYQQYAQQLVHDGHGFYCFASNEELEALRQYQTENQLPLGYDGRGLNLTAADIDARLKAGDPYVIRLKVPTEGCCSFVDMLRGEVNIDWAQVDMQVLLKQDGMPTYHLANVVDDHLMGITHVIRGEEWINSAPKHQLLYQYLGWDMPVLCHLPLLRNPDSSKLSKRKNPTSILYYQRMGYLAEAVVNYLGRMGWSMPNEQEKFTLQEMVDNFDLQRVTLGGPVFDQEKLSWLNGLWIREELDDIAFMQRMQAWAINTDYLAPIVPLIKPRVERFSDVVPLAGFFLSGMPSITKDDLVSGVSDEDKDSYRKLVQFVLWNMEALRTWNKDDIFTCCKTQAQAHNVKPKVLFRLLFIMITGSENSVSVFDAMAILGPDISRARVRYGLSLLGDTSKKEAKKWQKEYQLQGS